MRTVFVDCTTDLRRVIAERDIAMSDNLHIFHGDSTMDDLKSLSSDAEIILVEHSSIPTRYCTKPPHCVGLSSWGRGAGTYTDLAEADRQGIQVLTTPGYGDRAVAEHAMALMFAGTPCENSDPVARQ